MLRVYKMSTERSILWFRKGLRLHDNPALIDALKGNVEGFYPIFILDPQYVTEERVCANRFGFLLESLTDLNKQLQKKKSRLLIYKGNPIDVLPKIFSELNITKLCFESDTEPYARVRDFKVTEIAKEHKVEVSTHVSHTLYDLDHLYSKNNGRCPETMYSFSSLLNKVGKPHPMAADPPNVLPPLLDINEDLSIPTLQELGYENEKTSFLCGGETEALKILDNFLANTKKTLEFEKPKTNPASLEPDTTSLSPYLKFGCLSPKMFYYKLNEVYEKAKGKHTKPPVSLLGQLYFREMFYLNAAKVPNFDKIQGNPLCRRIDWDYNEEFILAWKEGQTGYPWIDACMKQLQIHGWLHHLARHCVACFLTRGDLYQSWEHGAAIFDKYLIDADWSLNNANWMWLSASAFFHQYFRVYSPIAFPKKYDKEGLFVKHYLPVLKKLPSTFIYEPWKAPLSVQKQAGCVVGKDYPKPIVDHTVVSKLNISRMKASYDKKQYGTSLTSALPCSPLSIQTGSVKKNDQPSTIKQAEKRKADDDHIQSRKIQKKDDNNICF